MASLALTGDEDEKQSASDAGDSPHNVAPRSPLREKRTSEKDRSERREEEQPVRKYGKKTGEAEKGTHLRDEAHSHVRERRPRDTVRDVSRRC